MAQNNGVQILVDFKYFQIAFELFEIAFVLKPFQVSYHVLLRLRKNFQSLELCEILLARVYK